MTGPIHPRLAEMQAAAERQGLVLDHSRDAEYSAAIYADEARQARKWGLVGAALRGLKNVTFTILAGILGV